MLPPAGESKLDMYLRKCTWTHEWKLEKGFRGLQGVKMGLCCRIWARGNKTGTGPRAV